VDFHQARFDSTMRLKDSWAQLAQRYARPLEEDDIIDLREVTILKDRGVVRNLGAQVNFGNVPLPDELGNDASSEAGGAPSEEDEDDFDEIDAFSRLPVQKRLEAQLRRVKPLHGGDSEDQDDLREFLEAERRTREVFGPLDEDFGEHLAELQEQVSNEGGDLADEVIEIFDSSDGECEQPDMSRTFTNSTNVDCDSEDEDGDEGEDGDGDGDDDDDELGGWEHDESNAIYEVVRTPIPEVIEIFDTPPSSPPSSPLTMSDPLSRSSSMPA
jgi:Centromere protein Scm3